jgi:hypothetical protein
MNWTITSFIWSCLLVFFSGTAQSNPYPQGYFRHPLNIPMQLVANFGEIRANHWHMGLDIRTNQKVNMPVYAAADGYIAKVSIEPGGFGQAIYINHPNGYTTLYGHLNSFFPALAQYVKAQQYKMQSWEADIILPAKLFPVKQGDFIALSGSTGASQGPHVHFEIRDTKTDKCLNPLLFGFPIADDVPPTVTRLALYDRNKSVYNQIPQFIGIRKEGRIYTTASVIKTGTNKISFAIGATDRFTNSANPNGIYAAALYLDNELQSEFVLDKISYTETRYINAQIDYRLHYNGGAYVQQLSPLPGDFGDVYHNGVPDGVINLQDEAPHKVRIEVRDANQNTSVVELEVQYENTGRTYTNNTNTFLPGNVNVFENSNFELYTTEYSMYDTVAISYTVNPQMGLNAVSPLHTFLSAAIPTHDSVRIRILPSVFIPEDKKDRVIIKSVAGTKTVIEKALRQGDWVGAKFRQFGTFQAFVDDQPPTINAPLSDLSRATRIIFVPKDNFNTIKSFRAELDGQWLMFTNDKGHSWIYSFDEHFPPGIHDLKVTVEDEAGNVTTKSWSVRR